ncbi:isoprenylcysteine carboxylmethyltransferase family protein [Gammaproteobacteria bacterium]|nr:isoprenylcysteine carboxylmethyltransferase family protein [Gammaproteobacteria bacterium]
MKVPSRLYPPHYLVLSIASIIGIDWLVPVPFVAAAFALIGGLLFLVIGLILAASAARLFSKAKTGIVPSSESTKLVVSGAYRFTRNPMYLGMFFCLIGVTLLVNNVVGLLVLLLFFLIIRQRFVLKEEVQMQETFGDDYAQFKARIRRWI